MASRSLLGRLLPPLVLVILALTVLVVLVGDVFIRRAVLDRAHVRAAALSGLERDVLYRLMRAGDHSDLQQWMEMTARHPDVAQVRLLSPEGVVRVSSAPAQVGRRAEQHVGQVASDGDEMRLPRTESHQHGDIIHTSQPIRTLAECRTCHRDAPEVMAVLDLDVAVNAHTTGLTAFRTFASLLGLLYLAGVLAVFGSTFRARVARPLGALRRAMRDVEKGDLSARLPPLGTREIDEVGAGFNMMVARLREGAAAEQEARRLQLERVEQLATVGELAAGLAHEIRNPLSGVKAVVDVIQRGMPSDDPKRPVLKDASQELLRIDQIVRELLNYARPKIPVPGVFDLNALVCEASQLTLAPATSNGAQVSCHLAEALPAANADAAMTRQILVNLVLNAMQAHVNPSDATIQVRTGRDDGVLWCSVQDNGPGVAADRSESIFKPFFTTKTRGTGLGLAVSRRLAELQGGRLILENPGEPGARFRFTIPAATGTP